MQYDTLQEFLDRWDREYSWASKAIRLFDARETGTLSLAQKGFFARSFYHIRGEFYKFLWYLGSTLPTEEHKEVVLGNIREEFGGKYSSHEQLYGEFAACFGVDIADEAVSGRTNLPFIREFNHGHIEWIMARGWQEGWAAFSAYERLDNIDYDNLCSLAHSFELEGRALLFFEVHRAVEHFQAASPLLEALWETNPQSVRDGFNFIGQHQIQLWQKLSDEVFLFPNNSKHPEQLQSAV